MILTPSGFSLQPIDYQEDNSIPLHWQDISPQPKAVKNVTKVMWTTGQYAPRLSVGGKGSSGGGLPGVLRHEPQDARFLASLIAIDLARELIARKACLPCRRSIPGGFPAGWVHGFAAGLSPLLGL